MLLISQNTMRAGLAAALVLAAVGLFGLSARIGGVTIDENVRRYAVEAQIRAPFEWLSGAPIPQERQLTEYYGLVPVGLVTAADIVWEESTGKALTALQFGIGLHAITFVFYLFAGLLVFRALKTCTRVRFIPHLGAGFLLLYPLWLGYGLFNFKDLPPATLVLLAVYAAARAVRAPDRDFARWSVLVVAATIALGGTRIAALALVVVPWVALIAVAIARGRRLLPVLAGLATALGIVAITPASWPNPIAYFGEALAIMSQFPWKGCVLVDGACMVPTSATWSAAEYLWRWAAVQLPIVLLVGLIPAMVIAVRRGGIGLIASATLIFSLAALVVRNANLYDGLRHVLFLVPLLVVVLFIGLDHCLATWRRPAAIPVAALILAEMATFVVDDVRMFPYNYVYFNLAARGGIDHTNYETDYWGFSLREAAEGAKAAGFARPVTGEPRHVVAAAMQGVASVRRLSQLQTAGYRGRYTLIRFTRAGRSVPKGCRSIVEVRRSLLGGPSLFLSYAARCRMGGRPRGGS